MDFLIELSKIIFLDQKINIKSSEGWLQERRSRVRRKEWREEVTVSKHLMKGGESLCLIVHLLCVCVLGGVAISFFISSHPSLLLLLSLLNSREPVSVCTRV